MKRHKLTQFWSCSPWFGGTICNLRSQPVLLPWIIWGWTWCFLLGRKLSGREPKAVTVQFIMSKSGQWKQWNIHTGKTQGIIHFYMHLKKKNTWYTWSCNIKSIKASYGHSLVMKGWLSKKHFTGHNEAASLTQKPFHIIGLGARGTCIVKPLRFMNNCHTT